jgi:hypothetical protein
VFGEDLLDRDAGLPDDYDMRRSFWLMLVLVLHAAVMPWATLRAEAVATPTCCETGGCCCAFTDHDGLPCPCAPRPERPVTPTGTTTAAAVKTDAAAAATKPAVVRVVRVEGGGDSRGDASDQARRRPAALVRVWCGPSAEERSVLNIWTT